LTPPQQLETAECLAWIGLRVSEESRLTRYRPAKAVCERFAWRDARGRPKEMACSKRLIAWSGAANWCCRRRDESHRGGERIRRQPRYGRR
jgi:hypothetical protein